MKYIKTLETYLGRNDIYAKTSLTDEEFDEACHLCAEELAAEFDGKIKPEHIYNDIVSSDKTLSTALFLKENNKMIGAIICSATTLDETISYYKNRKIRWFADPKDFTGNGLEGIAMSIRQEYRGGFAILKLKEALNNLSGFDYLVIQQYETLKSNINYLSKGSVKICQIVSKDSIIIYASKL